MKALILVGGYGTRLRPLTFTVPKPLVSFANIPICLHQILSLTKVGVKKIILAVNVEPSAMAEFNQRLSKELNIEIISSIETVPMGTAGPLALAKEHLLKDDSPFFMFNSDVICEFPLASMLQFHKNHGKEGTIFVTKVDDPSKYGVVVAKENGEIQSFVEKPTTFVGDKINAGIYLFNPSIVKRVQERPTSIEKEIFPAMASQQQLYSMVLPGYWMDIGQPKDFLKGMSLHLHYLASQTSNNAISNYNAADRVAHYGSLQVLTKGPNIVGNVLVHPSAKISASARIGPDVVIGANCDIQDGARIQSSTILDDTVVQPHAFISNSLIGWKNTVGSHSYTQHTITGEDVGISKEISAQNVIICPHKSLGATPAPSTTTTIIL